MFNVKVFADFEAPAAASQQDRKLLETLVSVRKSTGAQFVNLSVFDYRKENPDVVHFLTYPMDWISHYVRHFYSGIDPLPHDRFPARRPYRLARHLQSTGRRLRYSSASSTTAWDKTRSR